MKAPGGGAYSADALNQELAALYAESPDMLVVGSLGRAGLFNAYVGNALHEFESRGEHPLHGNKPRDIDVINCNTTISQPFTVDSEAFDQPLVRIVRDGTDWFLLSDGQQFCEPLAADVMEPVAVRTVFDIACKTVPSQTHIALYGICGITRNKDNHTRALLEAALANSDEPSLPAELYTPFDELRAYNRDLVVTQLRSWYRTRIPLSVRSQLMPLVRPFKKFADKHVHIKHAQDTPKGPFFDTI